MDISSLWNSLSAVLLIFLMVAVGFILGKMKIMRSDHKQFITKFIVKFAVPCVCVKNVFTSFTADMLKNAGAYLLAPILCMSFTLALALLLAKLFKVTKKRYGTFVVMCAFSNSLFIGYPICNELFGEAGIPYVMFFYIINTAFFWTVGSYLITRSGIEGKPRFNLGGAIKSVFTPPLVSLIVSVVLLLAGFEPPHLIISFCTYLGNTVTPLALLYVGFIMFETGLSHIRMSWQIVCVLVMRFVVAPVSMFFLCHFLGITDVGLGVMVIQASMPVMTQSVVVSSLAHADEQFAAIGMTLSTFACFVVVPILMSII